MSNSVLNHISRAGDSNLILDYLEKKEELKDFIFDFPSLESILNAAEGRDFSASSREVLYQTIRNQYDRAQIDIPMFWGEILNENTFTITTGHQLNLFGGPKYFIYKIISVLKLVERLNDHQKDKKFLPVFWMATEDHDFEEINQVNIFGKKLSTSKKATGPVGRVDTLLFEETKFELAKVLGTSLRAKELLNLFDRAFEHANWADFTRQWVHDLFEGKVVIVDGDDAKLKQLFSEIAIQEIKAQVTDRNVSLANSSLSDLGYHAQVSHRNINLFYIEKGIRERIDILNGGYRIHNLSRSLTLEEVTKHPDCISPNALLRPVYQELVLPNVAYVGGPGELAYWFQLKGLFDELKVSFPLLVMRDSFLFVEKSDLDLLNDLGVSLEELQNENAVLIKSYIQKNELKNIDFENERERLFDIFKTIENKISSMHRDYRSMIEAEKTRVQKFIEKMELRAFRDAKFKEDVNIRKVLSLKQKYFPNGVLIERKTSFMEDYLELGRTEYFSQLKSCSDVFDSRIKVITVNK